MPSCLPPMPAHAARCARPPVPLAGETAGGSRRSRCRRMLCVVPGEQSPGSADPPRFSDELGHLVEAGLAEPYQDGRVVVVVGRDEEPARLGLEEFVAI